MPFVIGEAINSASDSLLGSPFILRVAKSPIYTSLIIAVCIFFIILFVFRSVATEDYIGSMAFRASFWTFLTALVVMFLHNKVLMAEIQESVKVNAYETVINNTAALPPPDLAHIDFTKDIS